MAHSIIAPPFGIPTTATLPSKHNHQQQQNPTFFKVSVSKSQDETLTNRRNMALRLMTGMVVVGLNDVGRSNAAGRRPPPPPPVDKKDPNVSGVLAKVLASKKRKEAMKESMAKLREKGKSINAE